MSDSDSINIPPGYCHCGCGERTKPARRTSGERGLVKGEPTFYLWGHQRRGSFKLGPRYLEENRGYKTPCWIWQPKARNNGYAPTYHEGKNQPAHRVYYEQRYGPIPKGLVLDHLCRVRDCVNPAHLEPVTQAENSRRGNQAKLHPLQVKEIRKLHAQGVLSQTLIAKKYSVSIATISRAVNRKSWT